MRIAALSGWTGEQKHVVAASFLGWTLDAFDFFLLVFVLRDIAKEFTTDITAVTWAITLTLAMRPIGAYIFGRAADRWGTPADRDGQRPALFGHRIRLWIFAQPDRPAGAPRNLWHRHGR